MRLNLNYKIMIVLIENKCRIMKMKYVNLKNKSMKNVKQYNTISK